MSDLSLLDCTLRDGGYINNWNWGFHCAKDIIYALVRANIDVIEVGFLRNVEEYLQDVTVCNYIEELNRLLPVETEGKMFSAMAMCSNYDVDKLSPYCGSGIQLIRITAHEYDLQDGLEFAKKVKDKGYLVSINPINIMGYSDEQIINMLKKVNEIHPYQFAIVDTFGSMKHRDLNRIVSLVDNNIDRDIRLALHLHENMSLSCSLAQRFVDYHLNRPITIDGSLMGMGRVPGNLPIELIADYLNDCSGKNYDMDYLLDAIQEYIAPIKKESEWGYLPEYFLSARFNLHRNYAEYYLEKGDLTCRDINHILARFSRNEAAVFSKKYADSLYEEYKNNIVYDAVAKDELKGILQRKKILILAPGSTLYSHQDVIKDYIKNNNPVVIAVNFVPEIYNADFVFFSNSKRYSKFKKGKYKAIVTSNLEKENADYYIDYNSLSSAFSYGGNSLVLLLKLLNDIQVYKVALAGADGYIENKMNYFDSSMRSHVKRGNRFNLAITEAIRKIGISIEFITPSEYNRR